MGTPWPVIGGPTIRRRPPPRRTATLAGVALVAALAGGLMPGTARSAPADQTGVAGTATPPPEITASGAERIDAWERLREAESDLTALRGEVRRTAREVAHLDERLADASADLDAVTTELAAAEARLAVARTTERDSAARLEAITAQLQTALTTWGSHRDRLESRAIAAFKHGADPASDVLLRSLAGATDWHEVTVAVETMSRMLHDDRAMVTDAAELSRDTAQLEAEVAAARVDAVAAARSATEEQRLVAQLFADQTVLVDDIARERDERSQRLAALEASAAARAVLVSELDDTVAELGFTSGQWFVPIQGAMRFDGPAPAWAGGLPPAGQQWAATIEAVAARHGIDGRLMAALVWSESNFNPGVVSHAGAMGLAQLMPGTARGLGVDPRDPVANLDGGTRYLRAQLDRFGRLDLALAAYNAGPNRVAAVGRVPHIVETQLYVVRVMERYERLLALPTDAG